MFSLQSFWVNLYFLFQKGVFGGTLIGMQLMGRDKGGEGGVIVNMSSAVGKLSLQLYFFIDFVFIIS